MEAPVAPLLSTAILAIGPLAASHGTWKLICCCPLTLSTANSGAVELLTVTETFKNSVGSGSPEVRLMPVLEVRLFPNRVAISPGTTPPPTKLAPFTTAATEATRAPPLQIHVSAPGTGIKLLVATPPPNRSEE